VMLAIELSMNIKDSNKIWQYVDSSKVLVYILEVLVDGDS
jgi:hypothetical protein